MWGSVSVFVCMCMCMCMYVFLSQNDDDKLWFCACFDQLLVVSNDIKNYEQTNIIRIQMTLT